MSRRGDMSAVADLLKAYYRDSKANPWHQIYKDIQMYWQKEHPKEDISEILLLLREAIFGALEILCFGLVSEISTPKILTLLTSELNWNAGRRAARNYCLNVAEELIAQGKVRYLLPSALKRDDFGFLIPRVEEAQWDNFMKAKPKISRGKLDLSKLEESVLGSRFLSEQMIMETKLDSSDPRVSVLLEAYELQLVEIEVNRSSRIQPAALTEQITLNGGVVQEIEEEKETSTKKRKQVEVVTPLTDFLEVSSKKSKKKTPEKPVKKSRRRKAK
ncbi:MAG: hypothetical protein ACFFCT_14015 [Candidatus Odinarchaeota archaeon]